ncbi:MAG: glycosyltransferase family 4 protein, partial [Solirubrobacteraceae bacterium]
KRYKRIEVVLDVLARNPGAVLEIAGEGDHRPALEAEIDARGLRERVTMHGHVSEERKLELYRRAWVNITTSSAEGWGLSVTEAGACATPSAALRLGGLAEAIDDGRTGVLAETPAELATKVGRVLADPALRDALGRAAHARASEFTWDATARRTLQLLDAERRRAHPGATPAVGCEPSDVGDALVAGAPVAGTMPA